jgi:hypothetical protein
MLHARPSLLVPLLLVLLAPRAAMADEPVPWHHRPPIVLPEEGPPPWGAPGVVYLHVDTRAPRLELRILDGILSYGRRRGRHILSRHLCAAPCDQIVDAREGARYFFSGPGLVSSDYFRLNGRSGPVTARVEAGSQRLGESGGLAAALGLLSATAGGVLVGLGRSDPVGSRGMLVAGGVLLTNGAVALVTGAILLARGSTRVSFSLPVPP